MVESTFGVLDKHEHGHSFRNGHHCDPRRIVWHGGGGGGRVRHFKPNLLKTRLVSGGVIVVIYTGTYVYIYIYIYIYIGYQTPQRNNRSSDTGAYWVASRSYMLLGINITIASNCSTHELHYNQRTTTINQHK